MSATISIFDTRKNRLIMANDSKKNLRIIVVEDDELNRLLVKTLLNSSGKFSIVAEFPSANLALDFINQNPLDGSWKTIVLTAFDMKEMSGKQFVTEFFKLNISVKGDHSLLVMTSGLIDPQSVDWFNDRKIPQLLRPLNVEHLPKLSGEE